MGKNVEYSLSERLRFLREQRRLSQKDFAKAVGISQSSVAQIEAGRKEPSLETLRKIAKCLDIDMATVFASQDVHVFDLSRLRRKYKHADELSPHLYTAIGKVVQFARDIKFLK